LRRTRPDLKEAYGNCDTGEEIESDVRGGYNPRNRHKLREMVAGGKKTIPTRNVCPRLEKNKGEQMGGTKRSESN